jgi:hypothetical protein
MRLKIDTAMEVGGGVSGIFTGGGSFGATLQISDAINRDQLGIYYVQNGGQIAGLPSKLEDIAARVAALPTEAKNHGRPLYLVLVPYQELYNWRLPFDIPAEMDLRTTLIRYFQRLKSLFFELQTVITDFRRGPLEPNQYDYLHDSVHQLRAVDYAILSDQIFGEMTTALSWLRELDNTCVRRAAVMPDATNHRKLCADIAWKITHSMDFTQEFKFAVKMPVPVNALRNDSLKTITDRSVDADRRKFLLSLALYAHWVERPAKQRCSWFLECLDQKQRQAAYDAIKASLSMPASTAISLGGR